MAFEFIQGLKGSLWPLFTVPPTSMELILRSPRLLEPASSCASTPETCHNTAVDDAAGEQASGDHRQREGASSRGSRRRGPASAEAPTMLSRMREVAGSQQRGLSSAQARAEEGLASEGQPHVEVPQQVLLGLLQAVRELSEAVALVRAQKSARLHSACHGCYAQMLRPINARGHAKPFPCPVCRVETLVKGGQAGSLPKVFSLLR